MKLPAILSAILFAAISSLSIGAYAADAEKAHADAPATKMTPHSHMQEKTGVAPKAAAAPAEEKSDQATADKPAAGKKKSKHFHPRDGK